MEIGMAACDGIYKRCAHIKKVLGKLLASDAPEGAFFTFSLFFYSFLI
jgi:hypothetical protein